MTPSRLPPHHNNNMELSKFAGLLVSPSGAREDLESHATAFATVRSKLWPILAKEMVESGMGHAEAMSVAKNEIDKYGPDNYHTLNMMLIARGWMIIDDSSRAKSSFGAAIAMARALPDMQKNESILMQYLTKEPVLLVYEGADAGILVSPEDVQEAASLVQAIELAKTRSVAPVAANLSCKDMGLWQSPPRCGISWRA